MRLKALLALLITFAAITGCRSSNPAPAANAAPEKTFIVHARIVQVEGKSLLLDHEAIPGYMEAMTMSYKLKDPSIASELHPGDRITARLLVYPDGNPFRSPELDQIVVVAQARPDTVPKVQYHTPERGDTVPDFHLVNQSGRPIALSQFKGKALLITFIYTRCPLPEFCIRMSRNFAEIDKALAADPALYKQTHLLSISFDPTYDTPKVLRAYGSNYTGRHAQEDFGHWDFAVPAQKDLEPLTQYFAVGITDADTPATLAHSLSTILIGKDGKIAAWYPTNDWQPAEVVAAIRKSAA